MMVQDVFTKKMKEFRGILEHIKTSDSFDELTRLEQKIYPKTSLLSHELSKSSRIFNNRSLMKEMKQRSMDYLKMKEMGNKEKMNKFSGNLRAMYHLESLYDRPLVKMKTVEPILKKAVTRAIEKRRKELTYGNLYANVAHGKEVKLSVDRKHIKMLCHNKSLNFNTMDAWKYFDKVLGLSEHHIDKHASTPYHLGIKMLDYKDYTMTLLVSVYEKEVSDTVIRTKVREYTIERNI